MMSHAERQAIAEATAQRLKAEHGFVNVIVALVDLDVEAFRLSCGMVGHCRDCIVETATRIVVQATLGDVVSSAEIGKGAS